ncbi:MAG: BrnT family toxin [Bosea sp. (in: a-proteobacteria)]|uniref:BrnT family toxin n=1 Tax=Bosea sp. (in: a-proteobacteria) TaxID=1871050 RepID=UPI0027368DE3|nr:BrnT family toxin [Bosea sp. (in: a-proteobacteria)]MDP3254426.1 BrnT family toxin [Bosea sp. (in: a-proteobacteria)]MDP3320821.1 BrnT family toxin [Bosea sp. (in: a-proteobacteria)]
MEFEWDEAKRQQIISSRGVDILKAARIFEGYVLTSVDARQDYGELRYRAIGMVGEDCFILIYTRRDEGIRLITAWKGGRHERQRYQASIAR